MSNIVYVHAYTNDSEIQRELIRFFSRINEGKIKGEIGGLTRLEPVLVPEKLEELVAQHPLKFKDLLNQYPFEGLGIWTEWSQTEDIGAFYGSELHKGFIKYAHTTLDRAWYLVAHFVDDKPKIREIKKNSQ